MDDYPLFRKHIGVWEGTYTLIDRRTGDLLDRHESRLTCTIEGDAWRQLNQYRWPDGRTDEVTFNGLFRDGLLLFDTPRLTGQAVEADERVIVLRWVYTDSPDDEYAEIITLMGDDHRCRTWQHFEKGDFAKLTLIDERRVS